MTEVHLTCFSSSFSLKEISSSFILQFRYRSLKHSGFSETFKSCTELESVTVRCTSQKKDSTFAQASGTIAALFHYIVEEEFTLKINSI